MDSYTLKEHKHTGELHLFIGTFNPPGSAHKCASHHSSICKKRHSRRTEETSSPASKKMRLGYRVLRQDARCAEFV